MVEAFEWRVSENPSVSNIIVEEELHAQTNVNCDMYDVRTAYDVVHVFYRVIKICWGLCVRHASRAPLSVSFSTSLSALRNNNNFKGNIFRCKVNTFPRQSSRPHKSAHRTDTDPANRLKLLHFSRSTTASVTVTRTGLKIVNKRCLV